MCEGLLKGVGWPYGDSLYDICAIWDSISHLRDALLSKSVQWNSYGCTLVKALYGEIREHALKIYRLAHLCINNLP